MKSIKIILLLGIIFIISCEDFLSRTPLNNLSDASFFKQDGDFKLFTDGFYTYFTEGPSPSIWLEYRTDLIGQWAPKSGNRSYPELHNGNMSPTSNAASIYWNWVPIRNAYTLLESIDNVELSETNKKIYLGTTYYLLAYRYFIMFRAYERVPIIKKVLEISESDVPSSPKEDVFAEALDNINKAIDLLPSLSPSERERGRLTKLVALTLKADLLLYTSSYYNESIPGAKYKDAALAAKSALDEANSKGYGLCNDFNSLFIADKQADAEPQKEIIFEYIRLKTIATNSFSYHNFGPHKDKIGWGDFSLTQECVDMFECVDGKKINKSSIYNPEAPFENRDPRFTLTTIYPGRICTFNNGQKWIANTLSEYEYDNIGNKTNVINNDYMKTIESPLDRSPSGYINIKYWDRYNRDGGHTSFINYRYSELMLMYAEAMNEAYGPSSEVYDILTELRARPTVEMPPITEEDYPTKAALRDLIHNERVVELLCEGKRYWDLKRWHLFEERLNMTHNSMHIAKTFNPDGTTATFMDKLNIVVSLDKSITKDFDIPNGVNGGELMHTSIFPKDEKYYVWPIPEYAINASKTKALKQHPLWE